MVFDMNQYPLEKKEMFKKSNMIFFYIDLLNSIDLTNIVLENMSRNKTTHILNVSIE